MKLQDLQEQEEKKGTYAGIHFDEDTKDRIMKFIKDNKIPNPIARDKLHTTLIYSRKHLPKYEAAGKIDPPWTAEPTEFDVWKTQPDDKGNTARCLVMKIECTECTERHHKIMDEHNGTFDYDEYRPHITLSYDIGDFKTKDLPDPSTIGDLKAVKEYKEDLNLNWAQDNT